MKGLIPFLVAMFLFAGHAFTQNYNMNGTPISDCNGSFFDNGGASGNYGNNQNLSTTLCASGSGGTHVRLEFSGVDLAPGDELCFFDGSNLSAPPLSCASDYTPGAPFTVQATAANSGGCLTVSFNSNASGNATGWSSVISCVASCQTVLADLTSTNPATEPADTGWIDVCPGQRIFFTGQGIYPQNGVVYQQSDLTTTFEWNFGDGANIAYGPSVSHTFTDPGGYYVQMTLTDVKGCKSINLVNQRVRVAPKPNFSLAGQLDNRICAGDTIHLSASVNSGNSGLVVTTNTQSFATEGIRSDSLPLPDGTGIPYKTSIYATQFTPGQILTSASDLESICLNMEHSWMRDMEISIKCPNGSEVTLHDFGGQTGSQIFLGEPFENDETLPLPVPGEGYEYCWTPTATNPSWLQFANNNFGPGGGTLPAGNYQSADPLSGLVGCPLNGQWTITVLDLWPVDNGFIFNWSLKFKDQLYPNIETFTPGIVSWNWNNHPSIFAQTNNDISAAPQNAGTAGYTFRVKDEYGCFWDTLINYIVQPFTHPDCFKCLDNFKKLRDTLICAGENVPLDANLIGQSTQNIRFEAFPDYKFGFANHPPQNPFASAIAVSSLGFSNLTDALGQIEKVCVDIETDFDADLAIALRSPDGKQIDLSSNNGLSGDNYKITCFSPTATISILAGTPPFNGTFRPEGNWATLNGSQVNGDWKLVVSDNAGPTKYGTVKWWSIGFKSPYNVAYDWQNAATLSCDDCPNPIATPSMTTDYVLHTLDNFNCEYRDTVSVKVFAGFAAPGNLDVANMQNGQMIFVWDAVPGAISYQVNVGNTGWVPANGQNMHTVAGLAPGDVVNLEVRVVGLNPNCPSQEAAYQQVYTPCNMSATLSSTLPAKCPGTPTGSAYISVSQAVSPVKYITDAGSMFTSGGITNHFTAGNHFVIVEDAIGCRDTVYFNITEPPAIVINATAVDATCDGDNDGSATALASGGTGGPYTYQWQGCTGGSIINGATANNLYAGCYNVTVSDNNDCEATATVTVNEPPGFQFTSTQDSVSCYGGSDGSATIFVTGGQGPYSYLWQNGATTQTAMGLKAGFHAVTVTDADGCQRSALATVLQPTAVTIDSVPSAGVKCFNDSDGTATVFVHGGTAPYTYAWETGATTQTANMLIGGDLYTITVTDRNGCTDVSGAVIPEPPAIQLSTTNIQAEKCAGACNGALTLVSSGGIGTLDFFWNNGVPNNTTNSNTLCPGTYTVTAVDDKGCSTTATAVVAAATPIQIQFAPTVPKCFASTDGALAGSVTGGDAPYTYLWNNGSTLPNLTGIGCGDYRLTVTDDSGCTRTSTSTLTCPPLLQVTNVLETPAKCFGEANGSLAASATGGTPPLNYAWNDPNSQQSANAINLLAGNYSVQVTDANGCIANEQGTVSQPQALLATIEPTDIRCFGETTGIAEANVTGGTGPFGYAWTGGGTTQTISNLSAGTYGLTVTDANGCRYDLASTVINQPGTALAVSAVQTDTSCFGYNQSSASASASGGNGAPYDYDWSATLSGQTQNNLGNGDYVLTVSDSKGCTATTNISITDYLEIQANVATSKPSCYGLSDGEATVNNVSGGSGGGNPNAYNYAWSIPSAPNSNFVNNLAGGQTYTLTITDSRGCTQGFNFAIDQPNPIEVKTSSKSVSCNGLSDGEAIVTEVTADNPIQDYLWSNSVPGNQITGVPAGTYYVTVTDDKGCTGVAPAEVNQPDLLNISKFEVEKLGCTGDSTGAATPVVVGGTPSYRFLWENGATTASVDELKAGVYSVTVIDQNNCEVIDSVVIDQPAPMTLQLEVENVECAGLKNGRIRVIASNGVQPFRYSRDGQVFNGSSTFFNLGAGDYTFYVKDGNGCSTSVVGSVVEPDPVEVTLFSDTTLTLGDSIAIIPEVQNGVGILSYEWKTSYNQAYTCLDSICTSIMVKPFITNTYEVIVTDENGCFGSAEVRIKIEKFRGVYVPTGFTPNEDLTNDLLCVFGKSRMIRQVNVFRVFDRWGEMVYEDTNFQINDKARGWNGKYRDKDCDAGQYVWFVEVEYIDGYKETHQGGTQLIR